MEVEVALRELEESRQEGEGSALLATGHTRECG